MGLGKKLAAMRDHLIEEGSKPGWLADLTDRDCDARNCTNKCRGNNVLCDRHVACL